jgi:exopolysaccharide/PEP-CTERM locus tyrosine autokinase
LEKIAKAMGKYAQERHSGRLPKLTRADQVALLSYNRKTGHLLNPDTTTGKLGNHRMGKLKNLGTHNRLLDHKLIFPSGKLTAKGLNECERLKKQFQVRKPAMDADIYNKQKSTKDTDTDDVTNELEKKVKTVDPSEVDEASTKKVVLSLLNRPAAIKPGPTLQPEIKEASTTLLPVEEDVIKRGKQETTTDKDKSVAAVPGIPAKLDDKKVKVDRSSVPVPKVSFDDKRLSKNLVSLVNPQSYEAEQFKMLRNSILFPVAGAALQSILVTSSLPGEGKSFVSSNLAISIAMNVNRHVLLIDSDLRKPDLHRVFGVDDVPGLSDFLAERRQLDSLLLRTNVERLTLLPGGPIPPNPSELTSSERMSEMLEEVKHRYKDRLIVIDSPPPGLAAETSFLARQVDGIILVVKHGKTSREEVEDLIGTVGSEKILGVVINYLDMPLSKRYGYGKYGRYGGYGKGKK